ncbi:hypothetical protein ES708_20962 [subsurface metagenome]
MRYGKVRCGVVRLGMELPSGRYEVWYGSVRYGLVRYGMVRFGEELPSGR